MAADRTNHGFNGLDKIFFRDNVILSAERGEVFVERPIPAPVWIFVELFLDFILFDLRNYFNARALLLCGIFLRALLR